MYRKLIALTIVTLAVLNLSACTGNKATGSPVAAGIGAGAGAGGAALLGAPAPVVIMAGLGGGSVGYWVTTLYYQSQGVRRVGGKAYQVGELIGIYIPTDEVFAPNTDDFLPQAPAILNSAVTILQRKPNNNILISGNTSGFYRPKWEQKLSEKRAAKVAAYFWDHGISAFKNQSIDNRKLQYTGYGDYFPISSTLTNTGIRQNSRIQITSYPSKEDLCLDKQHAVMRNYGTYKDTDISKLPAKKGCYNGDC